jgi:hypothetical protein
MNLADDVWAQCMRDYHAGRTEASRELEELLDLVYGVLDKRIAWGNDQAEGWRIERDAALYATFAARWGWLWASVGYAVIVCVFQEVEP